MSEAMDAIEIGVFTELTAAAIGIPIYQHVPEDTAPPVIIIGDLDSDDSISTKDDDLDEAIELEITTVMQTQQRKPVLITQARIKAALNGKAIMMPGFTIRPLWVSQSAVLLPDGENYVGTSRFRIMALAD
ncbi:tail completion protein gp17 [Sphingobium boeckii]|uniref:DUF3168 domain-containing protein n=1 Tax=Sphingobium boeckii TaxID=1082345 RepID=A0A7W9AEQ3_9SPHN|nr:hypothetical protein [Sphingobium boeckii]MBB5684293.1 hypothetical protein [Sphingobium boeckii]